MTESQSLVERLAGEAGASIETFLSGRREFKMTPDALGVFAELVARECLSVLEAHSRSMDELAKVQRKAGNEEGAANARTRKLALFSVDEEIRQRFGVGE